LLGEGAVEIHKPHAAKSWGEFLIEIGTIVLGILIALSLEQTIEAIRQHDKEQKALVRLEQESEADVTMLRGFTARFGQLTDDEAAAVAALSAGDKARFDSHELAQRVGTLYVYPGITPPRAVYDELSASGQFNDIGSFEARTAVAEYYAELSFAQSQLDYFRQDTSLSSTFGQTTVYDPKAPPANQFVYTADFDVMHGNQAYMTALANKLRDQVQTQRYRVYLVARAVTMCKALAQALHKICAAATAPIPSEH
jgi:hypothetical protein